MRIFAFDTRISEAISMYGSERLLFSKIARLAQPARISFMQIGPQGVIGYHQALFPQLFLVVEGQGWVRGEVEERISIQRGEAAYWEAGEWHESGSDAGMSAIVIEVETDNFEPGKILLEITQ